MAYISIYDATPLDEHQLTALLQPTDHYWTYCRDQIALDNLHPESEIISVFIGSTVTREIIERLPRLRLIACRSTGYNNIDMAAAREHGITVVNVPSYGERTVAEYTFALLLSLTRKLQATTQAVQAATYDQAAIMGTDLAGKTMGIIGMGRIGRHVAGIARAFGMEVLVYDPYPDETAARELSVELVSLDELAGRSDIISLHSPYTGDNHHLINDAFLSKAKSGAILINTARDELVDTRALIDALRTGRLAGAGLDVLEGEQLLKLDKELQVLNKDTLSGKTSAQSLQLDVLKRFANVIITPHNAFNTIEALERINRTTADNMIRFWYGETPNAVSAPDTRPGKLVIARHGESEWNAEGRWSGTRDVHLSEKGFHEAALLGQAVSDIQFDIAFTSQQIRTFETMSGMLDSIQQFDVPYRRDTALNERDYGEYTGLNKWQVKEKLGEDVFRHLRRDWDYPVPGGESLRMVYERAVPFYRQVILPELLSGKNVLVVSHGNAIRALVKYIEDISDEGIGGIEMLFGSILIYDVDHDGRMQHKRVAHIRTTPPNA
ncbi:2,3-bisphosphoglycerate-dependent phosphoglycerate mutase [Candidatus Saccharibacteria bacterium]|nr:2,3-bisphosphoglycerate-dependent phosphoglycerate mutase [Candidatus Saccharibacteria bacterium]